MKISTIAGLGYSIVSSGDDKHFARQRSSSQKLILKITLVNIVLCSLAIHT